MKQRTSSDKRLLSCDWGTSSFRLSLVTPGPFTLHARIQTEEGVGQIAGDSSPAAPFRTYLRQQVESLQKQCDTTLEGVPLVISGMASSNIGMEELPYGKVPLSLEDPDLITRHWPANDQFPYPLYLLSGIATDEDVMRGEETQLIGMLSELPQEDCTCILPGTHSKHADITDHGLTGFRTYMTGELFARLTASGTLAGAAAGDGTGLKRSAFLEGVETGVTGNLLNSLFGIRSRNLLQGALPSEGYDRLSGLLIGHELADLTRQPEKPVLLSGSPKLSKRYALALDHLQVSHTVLRDSENLVAKGHLHFLKTYTH